MLKPDVLSSLLELNHSVAIILEFATEYILGSTSQDSNQSISNYNSKQNIESNEFDGRRRTDTLRNHELPNVV